MIQYVLSFYKTWVDISPHVPICFYFNLMTVPRARSDSSVYLYLPNKLVDKVSHLKFTSLFYKVSWDEFALIMIVIAFVFTYNGQL